MDVPTNIVCSDCYFRFGVLFCNDAECQDYRKMGIDIIQFCPRCGSEDITIEPYEDED